jgi:DNA-binding response OmpR family regulator
MVSLRYAATTVVLVIEDDPAARQLYRAALSEGEFMVIDVNDGIQALRYLESYVPAAVVLDLGLPQLHGRDVLKEMAAHELTARIPVVVVTGTDEELNEGNVSRVLRKPVTGDTLLAAVRRGINARRQR